MCFVAKKGIYHHPVTGQKNKGEIKIRLYQ